jgi:hypothetical protein
MFTISLTVNCHLLITGYNQKRKEKERKKETSSTKTTLREG